MKIIFFGTSDIAAVALEALSAAGGHNIVRVVTQADKPKGRGQRIGVSPVKVLAKEKRLAIVQPKDLLEKEFLAQLGKDSAELFVVCSYGKILPKELLQIPEIYTINLHLSLLPCYRGAAPIQWALINGEALTGVTIFKMNEYLDRGEMILKKEIAITAGDTAATLTETLSQLGAGALVEAINLIAKGQAPLLAQDDQKATLAPKLKKEDGRIDWKQPAQKIQQRVRGLQPWPGAFTDYQGKLLKIIQSEVVPLGEQKNSGEIVEVDQQQGILVQTGLDGLLLQQLQLAGKRKMSAQEFIAGHKLIVGDSLG
ncbi:MAG: methionyl-tRNA formyltransferase [Candidatus Omnitrophota bacterium]